MNALEEALKKKKGDTKEKHKHVKGKDEKCKFCGKSLAQDEYVKEDGDNDR